MWRRQDAPAEGASVVALSVLEPPRVSCDVLFVFLGSSYAVYSHTLGA